MPRKSNTDKTPPDDFAPGYFHASDDPDTGLSRGYYEALSKGASALMLSGEIGSHSEFSSSEEDEFNGTDLTRTIQATPGVLHIKDLIGRGAFGSVYTANWKGLPAAVKVSPNMYTWAATWLTALASSVKVPCEHQPTQCMPTGAASAHGPLQSLAAMSQRKCTQVIEHDDEETHASFSPLSTGASLRSFPGTPLAALRCDDFCPPCTGALGSSEGTRLLSYPSTPLWQAAEAPLLTVQ